MKLPWYLLALAAMWICFALTLLIAFIAALLR